MIASRVHHNIETAPQQSTRNICALFYTATAFLFFQAFRYTISREPQAGNERLSEGDGCKVWTSRKYSAAILN